MAEAGNSSGDGEGIGPHKWFVELGVRDLYDANDNLIAGKALAPYRAKLAEIATRGRTHAIVTVDDGLPDTSPGGVLISCEDAQDHASVKAAWPEGRLPIETPPETTARRP